jgi:coenzyme F420-0:L-glutamate ligase / coenzyme F420-1:gamma-L-glutamate ligase
VTDKPRSLSVLPIPGLPEIRYGDDVGALIVASIPDLRTGDIVVVTSKIIAKAEGRTVPATERDAAITAESVRVVAERGTTRIVETRHGFVVAAAGVDASNVAAGTIVLLPVDPDASARRIRATIRDRCGITVGVVISDTFGRPWRVGQTDVAIGAAGVDPVSDYRGCDDGYGNRLSATQMAIADEIAAAAELMAGKLAQVPVVVLRGLTGVVTEDAGPGARSLVRPATEDWFRLGTREAGRAAIVERRTVRSFAEVPVDVEAVRRAVAAAVTAPAPHHTTPWRFVLVTSESNRRRLLDEMLAAWVADLHSDGMSPTSIRRRTSRGEVLRLAPLIIVPCLVRDGAHHYPDTRRSAAERSMFLLSMGAGIQNLLLSLSVEGLGAAWVSSTLFCPDVAAAALDLEPGWEPMGAVAVGYPAETPTERAEGAVSSFLISR